MFEKIDEVRCSQRGRASKSLRMAMSNSVTGASMQGNVGYSEKRTRKSRLCDDFESSARASSLRTISVCDGVSSLAVLCSNESQTNTVLSATVSKVRETSVKRERGGRLRDGERWVYSRNSQTNTDGNSMLRPQYMDFTLTSR